MPESQSGHVERKRFTWKWSWKRFLVVAFVAGAAAGGIRNYFFPRPMPPNPPEVMLAMNSDTARVEFFAGFSSSMPPPGFMPPPRFASQHGWPDPARPEVCELKVWTDQSIATSVFRFEPKDTGEMGAEIAGRLFADLAHPTKIAAGNGLSLQRPNSASDGFRLLQPGKYEFIVYAVKPAPAVPAPKPTNDPHHWQPPSSTSAPPAR